MLKKYGLYQKTATPLEVIIIGDFGKDLDDEHSLLVATALHKLGLIEIKAIVANLAPAEMRARVAKGTLIELDLGEIPVGVGSAMGNNIIDNYESDIPYIASDDSVESDGKLLLKQIFEEAEDKSITLILQSGLKDAADFLRDFEILFVKKIKKVSIMGGVQNPILTGQYIQPDSANNVTFDWSSGVWLYAKLQELKISMTILTRHSVYACQIPFSAYDELEKTGHIVGLNLKKRQYVSLQKLWLASCSSEGSKERGTLPLRCDKLWFQNTFLGGKEIQKNDSIFQYIEGFNLYDPMNLPSSIDFIANKFFDAREVEILGVKYKIFGPSPNESGVKDIDKLKVLVTSLEVYALTN